MLVLSRGINQRIMIGDSIILTIVQVKGGTVRIGIEAPPELPIAREELLKAQTPAVGRLSGMTTR